MGIKNKLVVNDSGDIANIGGSWQMKFHVNQDYRLLPKRTCLFY